MKTSLFITIAAAATLLTACSNDNEMETPWNGEIRLTTANAVMDVQTRAAQNLQLTQFATNEKISVFINEQDGGTSTTYTQPLVFTADGNGALTPASPQYFPQSGKGVDVYACYPQTAASVVTTAKDFTIQSNQSLDADYKKSDLMLGIPASNPVARTSSVALTFTHQLSKIDIELVPGTGFQASDLDGATVKLKSILPTISFNPKTGITGAATGTAADINVMTAATAVLTGSAIIVPQTIAINAPFIEVTLKGGGVLTHKIAAATSFATKSQYSYRITVKPSTLEVTSIITPWTAIGSVVNGDATM